MSVAIWILKKTSIFRKGDWGGNIISSSNAGCRGKCHRPIPDTSWLDQNAGISQDSCPQGAVGVPLLWEVELPPDNRIWNLNNHKFHGATPRQACLWNSLESKAAWWSSKCRIKVFSIDTFVVDSTPSSIVQVWHFSNLNLPFGNLPLLFRSALKTSCYFLRIQSWRLWLRLRWFA